MEEKGKFDHREREIGKLESEGVKESEEGGEKQGSASGCSVDRFP